MCGFCGRQYGAQPAAPPPAPRAFPAPAPSAPSANNSKLGLLIIVIAATLMLSVVGIMLLASPLLSEAGKALGSPASPRSQARATPSADAPHWWYSRFEQALVKGEGAVPNIVGIVGFSDGATRLVALEGKSGNRLWSVPGENGSDTYANGDDVILVYAPAKTLTRRDAKTGAVRWSIHVADFVHDITFGPGCASVRFGKPLGIDTQTGALKDCKPTREAQLRINRDVLHDVAFERGDVVLRCGIQTDDKPINPEPARFALSAKRGESLVWSAVPREMEPIWSSDGFGRSVALTPSGLFVFGRNPSDHHARWLLLDRLGHTTYSLAGPTKVDEAVWIAGGGSLVFVVHDQRLEAYQAETGSLVWAVAEPAPG